MSEPLSDDRLAQMAGRSWPGTPGPWSEEKVAGHVADVVTEWTDGGDARLVICEHAGDDAAFIAAAPDIRADLAAALAEIARVKAERDRLREVVMDHAEHLDECSAPPGPCTCGLTAVLEGIPAYRALSPGGDQEGGE